MTKSTIYNEVTAANTAYAGTFGDKAALAMPPARGFAILTCMDARLDPAKYAGLAEGDAHVIRNAGGRASDDAIRSLVISRRPRAAPPPATTSSGWRSAIWPKALSTTSNASASIR